MELGEVPHDGQAEPEAVARARPLGLELTEGLEDVRELVRGDALPGVLDGEDGVRAAALDGDGDPATRRRELERVADEVEDDLPQSLWVAQDGKGVLAVGRERDSLLLGLGAERFDRGFDELGEVEGPRLDRELAGHDARDVEELLDEAHLLPR